jgi:hypothetical protein
MSDPLMLGAGGGRIDAAAACFSAIDLENSRLTSTPLAGCATSAPHASGPRQYFADESTVLGKAAAFATRSSAAPMTVCVVHAVRLGIPP